MLNESKNRLQTLDPILWNRYLQWSSHNNIYDEEALEFILQGELQKAIAERKWFMRVFQRGNYHVITGMLVKSLGYEANVGPIEDFEAEARDNPTEALLEAYLDAVELDMKGYYNEV
jgi:hypothetical protein